MPSGADHLRPSERSWTVAVYVKGEKKPAGSGVLIDRRRVLTCRHVVESSGAVLRDPGQLSVAFAAATEDPYHDPHEVTRVDAATHPRADLAVLTLAEDAPADVTPAPLRRP